MAQNEVATRGYGFLEGFLAKKRYRMAERLIPDNIVKDRILDVGCGGNPVFLLNSKFNQRYGLDQLITESQKKKLEAENVFVDSYNVEIGASIPLEDNYFNVVTLLAVFEHIDPAKLVFVVSEIHRVLKPGGTLILTTPAKWTGWILNVLVALRLVSPHEIDEHKDSYSPRSICIVLEEGGFNREKMRTGFFELFMNIWAVAKK